MDKNNKYQIITLLVLVILLIIGFIIYANVNTNTTITNKYENVGINIDDLNIFYLNVGQADSTLITVNGYTMLIDSGNDSDGPNIVEFIKSQNITKIDYLIGTHIDEDHIGGMEYIINDQDINVGTIYMPYNIYDKDCYDEVKEASGDKLQTIESSYEITYSLR